MKSSETPVLLHITVIIVTTLFVDYELPYARFRNELIGTLCVEITEGKELNEACQTWNKRVDPVNYMKTTSPITKTQIKEAEKFVDQYEYTESFNRRAARIEDIEATEIIHSNVGESGIKPVSIFSNIKPTTSQHKRAEFNNVEEVPIEKFMKDILPGCTSVEAYLENKHESHMVTLTTANNKNSKPIFKWDNNFSWTFNGNLAGKSQIKQAVKDAGGNVNGVLNFRLAWNYDNNNDNSDLDLWAEEPNGQLIGYSKGFRKDQGNKRTPMSGQLDVDNRGPGNKLGVENITWIDKTKMKDGVYKVSVHQFTNRNSKGFKLEIEVENETYLYEYNSPVKDVVDVAEVTLLNGNFTVKHILPCSNAASKKIYGLDTNQFHKVNMVSLSPNHWGKNNIGNKHYFFFLENCQTFDKIRTFHNENLISDLAAHRKVLEVLASSTSIVPDTKQLSGLGFNSTVSDELIVKLGGSHKRIIKIKF